MTTTSEQNGWGGERPELGDPSLNE
jgi:hypothetical protein